MEKKTTVIESDEEVKIFLKNAFYFLAHAQDIKSDSRMSMARVPVINGLAYSGPFPIPTLGVYIEWWLNTPEATLEIKGVKYLVWFISGSPLSGNNKCSVVNEQGEFQTENLPNFSRLFRSFSIINSRYLKIKDNFEAFTLEETVSILRCSEKSENERHILVDCYFLRNRVTDLTEKLQWFQNDNNKLRQTIKTLIIEAHVESFKKQYHEYIEKERIAGQKYHQLLEQRAILRTKRRFGKIINTDFQRMIGPINRELEKLDSLLKHYNISDTIDFPLSDKFEKMNIKISFYDLEEYFSDSTKTN